jgi:hypothetical protein
MTQSIFSELLCADHGTRERVVCISVSWHGAHLSRKTKDLENSQASRSVNIQKRKAARTVAHACPVAACLFVLVIRRR